MQAFGSEAISPLLPPETPHPDAAHHGCPWAPSHVPVLGRHLLCRLWPGILGYNKSLSPRVSDIRVQQ